MIKQRMCTTAEIPAFEAALGFWLLFVKQVPEMYPFNFAIKVNGTVVGLLQVRCDASLCTVVCAFIENRDLARRSLN